MLYKTFGYNSWSRNEVPLTGVTRAAGSEAMLSHAQSMKHCMTPGLGSPVPVLLHPPCADECCRMSLGTDRFQCSSRRVLKGEMNVQGEPASHQYSTAWMKSASPYMSQSYPRYLPASHSGTHCTGMCKDQDASSRHRSCQRGSTPRL